MTSSSLTSIAHSAREHSDGWGLLALRLFVAQTLTLSLGLLSAVVNLAAFLGILWSLSGAFTIAPCRCSTPRTTAWWPSICMSVPSFLSSSTYLSLPG